MRAAAAALLAALFSAPAVFGKYRLVSIPDLHGDLGHATLILSAAKLVDPESLAWIGGNATVVQTGDIVDRGDEGKQIYELFFRLQGEAAAAGGAFHLLLGNHELMNLQNDLRYVSRGDYDAFGGKSKRAKAWAPDGWLGSKVRAFPAALKVGGVLFSHAGVLPKLLQNGANLDELNANMASALESLDGTRKGKKEHRHLFGEGGPVWTRQYADRGESKFCPMVHDVLEKVGAKRMVIGHTIQEERGICRVRPACGGRIVFGDTAVSRAYGGEVSYIEHDGEGGATVVYPRLGESKILQHPDGEKTEL